MADTIPPYQARVSPRRVGVCQPALSLLVVTVLTIFGLSFFALNPMECSGLACGTTTTSWASSQSKRIHKRKSTRVDDVHSHTLDEFVLNPGEHKFDGDRTGNMVVPSGKRAAKHRKNSAFRGLQQQVQRSRGDIFSLASSLSTEGKAGEYYQGNRIASSVAYGMRGRHGRPDYKNKIRLIFSITTGHTGSAWLVRCLRCSGAHVTADHEAKPALVSFPLLLRRGRQETLEFRSNEKLAPFLDVMHNATTSGAGSSYADVSHMFVKSWYDVLDAWLAIHDPQGIKYAVDVVVLRRYLPLVLRSYLIADKWSWTPTLNLATWGGGEYTVHHRHMATLPPMFEHGAEDSVDMVLGYLVDMELQYHAFRRSHPHFNYYEFRAEELFSNVDGTGKPVGGVRRLLSLMQLEPLEPLCMRVLGNAAPVNPHVEWRVGDAVAVPLDVYLARSLAYIGRYMKAGVPMPDFPHLRNVTACGTTVGRRSTGSSSTGGIDPFCEVPVPTKSLAEWESLAATPDVPNNKPAVKPPTPLFTHLGQLQRAVPPQ